VNLGPLEIGLIILAVLLLFGYKKLPDASRSIGRSLRIFKGEMKGMKDDDVRTDVRTKDAAETIPVVPPATTPPSVDLTAQLSAEAAEAEARAAEARAAELRARAEQARVTDGRG
jgi:sec-independent protein translocase protein TatA